MMTKNHVEPMKSPIEMAPFLRELSMETDSRLPERLMRVPDQREPAA
jgi:hypothetical protein